MHNNVKAYDKTVPYFHQCIIVSFIVDYNLLQRILPLNSGMIHSVPQPLEQHFCNPEQSESSLHIISQVLVSLTIDPKTFVKLTYEHKTVIVVTNFSFNFIVVERKE